MKEQVIIDHIEKWLNYKKRYYLNVHGSEYSNNGTHDIITHDINNQFLSIEAKAPNRQPKVNQWRHAIKVLKSGGRVIIAYEDFDLNKVDNNQLPVIKIGSNIGISEHDASNLKLKNTTEIKLI